MAQHTLTSLAIFQSLIRKERIRSLHVYESVEIEREFLFEKKKAYVEKKVEPLFGLRRPDKEKEISLGLVIDDTWKCIFVFRFNLSVIPRFPALLCLSRNPKLEDIPNLANDLKFISELKLKKKLPKIFDQEQDSPVECCSFDHKAKQLNVVVKEDRDQDCEVDQPKPRKFVLKQDLNCLPDSETESDETVYTRIEHSESGTDTKTDFLKKKRALSKHIAGLNLEDLSKYFGLTIVEASRKLNVGLTVLKKKCREFGIPRWPHRKIKSLDSLIQDLQGEVEGQPEKNKEAAIAAAKRRKKIETEKSNIVKKPFMEIQMETKRFRQNNFKRRHKASRAKKNQESLGGTSSSN